MPAYHLQFSLIFLIYLLLVNLTAFIQMGIDKKRARNKQWRISEARLFLPVLLGGSLGGLFGIYFFHHKTKHWYFPAGFGAALAVHIFLIALLLRFWL